MAATHWLMGGALAAAARETNAGYFVINKGRRLTKSQIFNAVYGLFDDGIEENVVESHISKLRKKLRARLAMTNRIQRFLGYMLRPRRRSRHC